MRVASLSLGLSIVIVRLFSFSSESFSQQDRIESCDVPVVVSWFNAQTRTMEQVKKFGPENFLIQLGGIGGSLDSVSIDGGPKRVALVLDASKNIPQDEWKLETEMAASFVSHARPGDKFLFLLIGTNGFPDSFLTPREVEEQLLRLGDSRPPATEDSARIYDALLEGANRLYPPSFGDVLFLVGRAEDSGSKTDADHLLEVILKNRLRFYGFSFSDPLRGKLPPGFNLNNKLPASIVFPKLADVSAATGYFMSFHNLQDLNYPGQIPLFKGFLGDWYSGIAEPYRLRIHMPTVKGKTKLEISLANLGDLKINARDLNYPHFIYPCTLPPSVTH
jgi:hypothetical protein